MNVEFLFHAAGELDVAERCDRDEKGRWTNSVRLVSDDREQISLRITRTETGEEEEVELEMYEYEIKNPENGRTFNVCVRCKMDRKMMVRLRDGLNLLLSLRETRYAR